MLGRKACQLSQTSSGVASLPSPNLKKAFAFVQQFAPGQNLERHIPSDGDIIFSYALDQTAASGFVKDTSKNGYDAHTTCETAQGASISQRTAICPPHGRQRVATTP
jgi:hypothetical protein